MKPPFVGANFDLLVSNKRKPVIYFTRILGFVLFPCHHLFTQQLPEQVKTLPKTANISTGIGVRNKRERHSRSVYRKPVPSTSANWSYLLFAP
jgi:hypothetical protein